MSTLEYPEYVHKMMVEAEHFLAVKDDPDPWEAAALCFDILALYPEHKGAQELIMSAHRNGRLIRDNRRALSRLIDEWDDRP